MQPEHLYCHSAIGLLFQVFRVPSALHRDLRCGALDIAEIVRREFDSKLDRTTNTFVILGLWLEDEALGNDEAFAEALACGFARFVTFLGANTLDATAIREPLLRQRACSS